LRRKILAAERKVKVSCLQCGTTNNVPESTRGKKIVCGRCKEVLPSPGVVVEPQPNQAYALFQKSALPVLGDFYSMSCMSCKLMHSVVMNLAERRKGELMVVRINVEEYPEMAAAFGIQGVPTFVILHRGNERARSVGEMAETDFSLWVAKLT
jgi:thioredoxin 2